MFFTILFGGLFMLIVWELLKDYSHPYNAFPGPPRLPLFGNIFTFMNIGQRELFVKARELFAAYGNRYAIKILKRRILQTKSPDDVELVMSHSKNITKSMPYTFLQPWLGTGLLLSTGLKWHRRRKILTPTFHFNILKNFFPIFEEKSQNMVAMLRKLDGKEQDLFPLISDVTLYAICETAMGTQLDQDKTSATVEYKKAVLEIGHLLMVRLTKAWLQNEFLFKRLPAGKRFQKVLHKVHAFSDAVILERKKQKSEQANKIDTDDAGVKRRVAMLDLLLEAEAKGEIDLEGIREEVNTFMFEGHDTTATALTFGIMLLADHEEVQERIYEEIQRVIGDRAPTMADYTELKYLEAVIKEVLRLYPSVPFIGRTVTEEFQIDGVRVPAGCEVAVHIYDLHRRPDLYPEPEAFKPERFLDNTRPTHPYGYVPFSAGPRNCIGQRFAMLEMKSMLVAVCRHFTLQDHGRQRGWRPQLVADMVLRSSDHIYVKFLPRVST